RQGLIQPPANGRAVREKETRDPDLAAEAVGVEGLAELVGERELFEQRSRRSGTRVEGNRPTDKSLVLRAHAAHGNIRGINGDQAAGGQRPNFGSGHSMSPVVR